MIVAQAVSAAKMIVTQAVSAATINISDKYKQI